MRRALLSLLLALSVTGCGRKGPPLPPLVRIPLAPADIAAARRGSDVEIQFTVPAANTDGSRPANIMRVEVYAIDGPPPARDTDLLQRATRVAAVDVKAPRDPDEVVDPEDAPEDAEPLEGPGLDQGREVRVEDRLVVPAVPAPNGLPAVEELRTYVGVGIDTKGRRGPLSTRVAVPLGPAPPAPSPPAVAYTETTMTISWAASASEAARRYFVYEIVPDTRPVRLNEAPLQAVTFVDTRAERIVWGDRRCYAVSALREVDKLRVESALSPEGCVTLVDTFPPKAPAGLQAVPAESVVSLIWDPSAEADIAGYLVLRGDAPGGDLAPITPAPILEAHFEDSTATRARPFVYAIVAVDKAGNRSAPSGRVGGTAR